jgi:TolA-binding protein
MTQVLEVGQQLAQVSAQIEEVNGKLTDLDSLLAALNHMQNLVRQSLEEGRLLHEEQARQRYVSLKMYEAISPGLTPEFVASVEERLRGEFDADLRNGSEGPASGSTVKPHVAPAAGAKAIAAALGLSREEIAAGAQLSVEGPVNGDQE